LITDSNNSLLGSLPLQSRELRGLINYQSSSTDADMTAAASSSTSQSPKTITVGVLGKQLSFARILHVSFLG
jgi:hypothetical protein